MDRKGEWKDDRRKNRRTDGMTDEKTDGGIDRTYFEGPFPLELGTK